MNVLNWKTSTAMGLLTAASLLAWQSGVAQEADVNVVAEQTGEQGAAEEGNVDVLIERRAPEGQTVYEPAPATTIRRRPAAANPSDRYGDSDRSTGVSRGYSGAYGGGYSGYGGDYGGRYNGYGPRGAQPQRLQGIREAAAALSTAEDDKTRNEAREKLDSLLNEYFEADMARREQELKAVEERVKKLHAQLERRREKKSDIIELQMKVLLNEADGMGFFSGDVPAINWLPKQGAGSVGWETRVEPSFDFSAPPQLLHAPPQATSDDELLVQPPRPGQPIRVPLPAGETLPPVPAPQPQPRR